MDDQHVDSPEVDRIEDLPPQVSDETADDVKGGAIDGIGRLIAVTQMKADEANKAAQKK